MEVREEIKVPPPPPDKVRAFLLLSGGLDSTLAGLLLARQGIDIVAISFKSPFFGYRNALKQAQQHNWPLLVIDITAEQLRIVEKPKHGYGKNMNPCIDCHAQMLRIAGDLMPAYGASFLVTGEVLGERPKSQNYRALRIVEEESGYPGLVLRPLSAKLLPPTIPEKKGWVKREELQAISGRSRKPQMALAAEFGLTDYPSPGGGCLLTDPGYSARLRRLLAWRGHLDVNDIELVKYGRSFFEGDCWFVIGRNRSENEKIAALYRKEEDVLITTSSVPGPLCLLRCRHGLPSPEVVEKAALLTIRYSKAREHAEATVRITTPSGSEERSYRYADWKPYLEAPYLPQF